MKIYSTHENFQHMKIYSISLITAAAAAAAKSLQLCPTLYDPVDCSLPGSSVHGILQARTLAWVVISLFNAWKWKVKVKSFSHVWLVATPWTAGYQAPPSMGFSRQEYWSEVLLPSLPYGASGKEPTCQCRRHKRHRYDPWVRKIPWRRKWQPAPICLPGKSHGQWRLAATVHGVTKSQTRLKQLSMHTSTEMLLNII